MLNEARSKISVNNCLNLGRYCRVGPIRAGCEGLSTRRNINFGGDSRAEAQVGFGGGEAICTVRGHLLESRNGGRPSRIMEIEVNLSRMELEMVL